MNMNLLEYGLPLQHEPQEKFHQLQEDGSSAGIDEYGETGGEVAYDGYNSQNHEQNVQYVSDLIDIHTAIT